MNIFRKIKTFILDSLYPPHCLSCQKEGRFICQDCFQKINYYPNQVCPLCEIKSPLGKVCHTCLQSSENSYLDGVYVSTFYHHNKIIKKLIHRFKYHYNRDLGHCISNLYLTNLEKSFFDNSLITFVPLHYGRRWMRGFNQSREISYFLGKSTGTKFLKLIQRVKNTPQQSKLLAVDRLTNVVNAFSLLKGVKISDSCKKIVLIDDVATTLATLQECAKVLKKEFNIPVWGMVLARA